MALGIPSFIEFHQSSMGEACDLSDIDDSDRYENFDLDTYTQISNDNAEQELQDMKNAIREANMNPLLLSKSFNLSSHSLLKSAMTGTTSSPTKKSRKSDDTLDSIQEPKRRKYYSTLEKTLNSVADKDNGSARIIDRYLQDMKAMVKEVKINPSLIYQKFDLPWTVKDLIEDHQQTCVMDLKAAGMKFPSLPFPVARRAKREEDASPRMEPCLNR